MPDSVSRQPKHIIYCSSSTLFFAGSFLTDFSHLCCEIFNLVELQLAIGSRFRCACVIYLSVYDLDVIHLIRSFIKLTNDESNHDLSDIYNNILINRYFQFKFNGINFGANT